jgi:ABC transporter substrate binding protein
MSLTMTKEEREALLADVHVAVISVEEDGYGPLVVPIWYSYEPGGEVRIITGRTTSVPLVMSAVGDPVGAGIVPSLSHPGGNITGLTAISTEMDAKRLELLREVVPSVSYIAVLWNAASPLQVLAEKQVQAAAQGAAPLQREVRRHAAVQSRYGRSH